MYDKVIIFFIWTYKLLHMKKIQIVLHLWCFEKKTAESFNDVTSKNKDSSKFQCVFEDFVSSLFSELISNFYYITYIWFKNKNKSLTKYKQWY